MQKIYVVGCTLKEQFRIKNFLDDTFEVKANISVHNSLEALAREPVHLILFDTRNAIPLSFFMKNIPISTASAPVVIISEKTKMKDVQVLHTMGVASVINSPYKKKGLLRGIQEGLSKRMVQSPKAKVSEPAAASRRPDVARKSETDILIGLRKSAVISKILRNGISFLLPASLDVGTKILFRNAEFHSLIGVNSDHPPILEITVKLCDEIAEFQYQVEADFVDEARKIFQNALIDYVDSNSPPRKFTSTPKTILVAERNSFTQKLFRSYLKEKGYRVLSADDGEQIFEILKKQSVDLVLTELVLPKMNGKDVIKKIRKNNMQMPIVVVTAENNPKVVREVLPLVQDILIKPIGGEKLMNSVEKVLGKWQKDSATLKDKKASYVNVRIDTNLMVAFRDTVKLLGNASDSLIFFRNGPIAPGTMIFLKADADSSENRKSTKKFRTGELKVSYCKIHPKNKKYLVRADYV